MKRLFLDDTRIPPLGWSVVRNFAEFKRYITENGMPDVISFDHDLSFEHYAIAEDEPGKEIPYESYCEKTGLDCARWLIEQGRLPSLCYVHSMNPVGAENIYKELESAYRRSERDDCRVYRARYDGRGIAALVV